MSRTSITLTALRDAIEHRALLATAEYLVCVDLIDKVSEKEAIERRAFRAETEENLCRDLLALVSESAGSKCQKHSGRRRDTDEDLLSFLTHKFQSAGLLSKRTARSETMVRRRYDFLAHRGLIERAEAPVRYRLRGGPS
jgi:hypothetical protein